MEDHRPYGLTPTTLEANILKLRGYEMLLILAYVEDLRKFVINSVRMTERRRATSKELIQTVNLSTEESKTSAKPPRNKGKVVEKVRKTLVDEGVITQAESDEFFDLINYRNYIGHDMRRLTGDVGPVLRNVR